MIKAFSKQSAPARLAAIFGLLVLVSQQAHAQIGIGVDDPAALALGVGSYDLIKGTDTQALFSAEYRFGSTLYGIRPLIGGEVTGKGTLYGFAGIGLDVGLSRHWVVTPDFAVGLWRQGEGKNLGNLVEFRTGFDIAYRFNDHSRFGLQLHHISNGGIGRRNPGEEDAMAFYSLPLGLIF